MEIKMEKKYLNIGEIAKKVGLSTSSLRYYHDIGILDPDNIDWKSGYRQFSPKQMYQLNFIKSLKSVNISIYDIKKQITNPHINSLFQLLSSQEETLAEEIKSLQLKVDKIKQLKSSINMEMESYDYYYRTGKLSDYSFENYALFRKNIDKKVDNFDIIDNQISVFYPKEGEKLQYSPMEYRFPIKVLNHIDKNVVKRVSSPSHTMVMNGPMDKVFHEIDRTCNKRDILEVHIIHMIGTNITINEDDFQTVVEFYNSPSI